MSKTFKSDHDELAEEIDVAQTEALRKVKITSENDMNIINTPAE